MQIFSWNSSLPASQLSSPRLPNSERMEIGPEEGQSSNQQINAISNEAEQSSDQKNSDITKTRSRDPEALNSSLQINQISKQQEQAKSSIFNRLDLVTKNLNRIYEKLDQLEPSTLYLLFPACILSLSFSIYAVSTLHKNPNNQSAQTLTNLLGQVDQISWQSEQAGSNMLDRLALIETELNRISGLSGQPKSKDMQDPAFYACIFSLFLCICTMGALWRKSNQQSVQKIKNLQSTVNAL